jgi:opacity protein-like surface antigen
MRLRSVLVCSLVLILPALAASPAHAQSVAEPQTWTISPFLGGSIGLDTPGGGNSMGVGFGVGYDLTSNVGFEGELGHLFDIAGDNDTVDWSVTNVSGNLMYHFDVRRVTPYATFGIGFEHSGVNVKSTANVVVLDPDSLQSSTEMSFNFGGGVKYPLTPKLLLRGDLRRFEANDLSPDFWRLYAGLTIRLGR